MNKFRITKISIIEESDIGWSEEAAGKAYLWGQYAPYPVESGSLQLFIDKNYTFEIKPTITDSNHPDTIFDIPEDSTEDDPRCTVFDIEKFMLKYEIEKQIPTCAYLIPAGSSAKADAPVELYDYPFTAMPLMDMCINSNRGGSSYKPVTCSQSDLSSSVSECNEYKESAPFDIGTIEEVPVTVTRFEDSNIYTYEDKEFASFKSLIGWCEESDFNFNLTFRPENNESSSFYEGALQRLAITYEK